MKKRVGLKEIKYAKTRIFIAEDLNTEEEMICYVRNFNEKWDCLYDYLNRPHFFIDVIDYKNGEYLVDIL